MKMITVLREREREREGGEEEEEEEEGESERETRIGRDCGGERKLKREKVE